MAPAKAKQAYLRGRRNGITGSRAYGTGPRVSNPGLYSVAINNYGMKIGSKPALQFSKSVVGSFAVQKLVSVQRQYIRRKWLDIETSTTRSSTPCMQAFGRGSSLTAPW